MRDRQARDLQRLALQLPLSRGARVRLVRRGLQVPDCAATHPHWFVQLFVTWAHHVFSNRHRLDRPVRDLNGHVIVQALPEWYVDPYPGERTEALKKRRADWTERRLQVLLAIVAHMSFREKVILPDPAATDYMTLAQIARELPDQECADPVDAIERAMRFLKAIGFISKVVQFRQKLIEGPNAGKFRSYGGALRRIGVRWLGAAEGMIAGGWKRLQAYLATKAEEYAAEKQAADDAFTDALARKDAPILIPRRAPPAPAPAPAPAHPDQIYFDEVEREHPDWIERQDLALIRAEVRRLKDRAARLPRDTS